MVSQLLRVIDLVLNVLPRHPSKLKKDNQANAIAVSEIFTFDWLSGYQLAKIFVNN